MYRLVISIILCVIVASSAIMAEQKLLRITTFGGLNTVSGDFSMKPGEARGAHNIDFGRNVGSVTKRYGYDAVSFLHGQDSIIGIYGAYFLDGTQRLVVVSDSANVGWGNIYISPPGKAQFVGTDVFDINVEVSLGVEYTYLDSIIIEDDTTVIAYTQAASPGIVVDTVEVCYVKPGHEPECWDRYDTLLTGDSANIAVSVATHIVDSINNNVAVNDTVLAILGANGNYSITPLNYEFYTITIPTDVNQTVVSNSANASRVRDYFSVLNKPSFAMYNDIVYIVNGSHKGVAYNGDIVRSWPLNAPGEPTIIPLTTRGPLSGEYRYAFSYLRGLDGDSSYGTIGGISSRVRITNGQMLLRDFQWVGSDIIDGSPDSVGIVVYRTKANIGRLDQRDSAFLIDTLWGESAADMATLSLLDSVADVDLANGVSIWVDSLLGQVANDADSVFSYSHSYGAPRYIGTDSLLLYTRDAGTDTDSLSVGGIFHGIPTQRDTIGVQYIVTFMDTVLGVESAPSTPLTYKQSDSVTIHPYSITIGLPNPVYGDSGIVRNLYRSHLLQISYDSVWRKLDTIDVFGGKRQTARYIWKSRRAIDTIVTSPFYLVAQITLDSANYTDSIRYDSLEAAGRLWEQLTPPLFMTQIFAHQNRMFGVSGSRLHISKLDSASAWGALDFISLNESDGDQITLAFISRGVIRVLKNHSSFNVYQDANLDWNLREVSNQWGCIAQHSYAASPLGHYYLSALGVVRESEGQFLERTQAVELISANLRNFTDLPINTLNTATGFYFDQKYMLSIGDTTYVYDERAKAWSTWSMTFSDATLYGTESELNFLPGDSMYFIQGGSSNLSRYGTSELDNGSPFQTRWRSGALLQNEPGYKHIQSIEMAFHSGDDDDIVFVGLYDEFDALVEGIGLPGALDLLVFDTLSTRYKHIAAGSHRGIRYIEVEILINLLGATSDAVIDLMDIHYSIGSVPIKN